MGLLLGPTTNSRLANAFQPIPLAWAETNSMEESTKTIVSNDNDRTNFGDTTSSSYDVERRVAAFLKHVPTFTLVDDQGVPFMVVGEDAKVTAYLFTTYNEAERILRMATQSAERALQEERLEQRQQEQERRSKQDVEQASTPTNDEKDDLLSINSNKNNSKKSNPWKAARISTVTLETAVSLALQTAKTKGNYFLLAATAGDIEDALEITGQSDLAEGRVPLFYYQDFTINSTTTNGSSTIQTNPLFFQKKQLEAAYRKANPGQTALPSTVLVTELFAVIQDMVRTTSALDDDDYEKNYASLVLVPPPDSAKRAEQCRRRKTTDGATPPPLVLGKRNLVL